MTAINTQKKHQVVRGPDGLKLELNAAEIYPADPGMGTPAMVWLRRASGTFECACQEGELDCGEVPLSEAQAAWLHEQAQAVDEWLDHWTALAKGGAQ